MNRRDFIAGGAVALAAGLTGQGCRTLAAEKPRLRTVQGDLKAEEAGVILPHEHVLVDFIGAAQISRSRYRREEVVAAAMPHLRRVKELGCQTLFECTPAYIGRDPILLRQLSQAAGLNLVTNTGYYGAGKNKYLPEHALTEPAEVMAARWIREAKEGIEESGIRPGFIKIGVDSGPLSEVHARLVQAAALTHRATGLTIAAHTGDGPAAMAELDIVERQGLKGESFVWVHAQSERNLEFHARAAERGAWVEFDGISSGTVDEHVRLVVAMKARGLLSRVLLSHDAGWYHVGEPGGGAYRSYETLFTRFIPALRGAGFVEREISQLVRDNPQRAFAVGVRA